MSSVPDPERPQPIRFRRDIRFGSGYHQPRSARNLISLVVLLLFVILAIWYLHRISRSNSTDSSGRQALEQLFGPKAPSARQPASPPESDDEPFSPVEITR